MKTAFPLVSALALLLGAAGASLAAPPQPVGGAVYTMSNAAAGNEVVVYPRAANGQLGAADRIATGGLGLGAGLGNQGGVALSDDGRWLFVVNAGSDDLSVFAVGEAGLTLVQTINSQGDRPVSVTQSGDLVYVLNAGSDSLAGFRMDAHGLLAPIPGSPRPLSGAGVGAAQIQFGLGGHALVVSEKASNKLVVYEIDRDGAPEAAPEVVDSVGPTPFGFDFGLRGHLFVSEAAGGAANASSVSSYRLTRDGRLETVSGAAPTGLTAACWVVVSPDGRFVYSADAGSNAISGYRAGPDGTLTLLDADGVTASTGAGSTPLDLAISVDGRYLYALNGGNHTLAEFRIGNDGGLTPIGALGGLPDKANGLVAR